MNDRPKKRGPKPGKKRAYRKPKAIDPETIAALKASFKPEQRVVPDDHPFPLISHDDFDRFRLDLGKKYDYVFNDFASVNQCQDCGMRFSRLKIIY